MKSIHFFLTLTVVSMSFFVACSDANSSSETTLEKSIIDPAKVLAVDYKIEGMTCKMGCAKTIEKTIAGLNGVAASSVNFDEEKGHFEFDASLISEKEIISAIENVADQYKVSKWTEGVDKEESKEKEIEEIPEETKTENKSTTNVKLLPSFEIPNIFKLLVNQL